MEKERRSAPRVKVKLPARWEGALHRENASITDLSVSGCFILSGGKVELKELVWLELQLPDQEPVQVWAEVVDQANEIGFAVRFNSIDDADQRHLVNYINDQLGRTQERRK
jgi:c-di-GMP-binding flagellar brake protein YcgR